MHLLHSEGESWKHQVREKKNSHWLHMFLNATPSRSCCSQPAAARSPRRRQRLMQRLHCELMGLFSPCVPQVAAAHVNVCSWNLILILFFSHKCFKTMGPRSRRVDKSRHIISGWRPLIFFFELKWHRYHEQISLETLSWICALDISLHNIVLKAKNSSCILTSWWSRHEINKTQLYF